MDRLPFLDRTSVIGDIKHCRTSLVIISLIQDFVTDLNVCASAYDEEKSSRSDEFSEATPVFAS